MSSLWILLLLIFISALPALAFFIWIRLRRYPLSPKWFLAALAGGVTALLIAAFLQSFFPVSTEASLRLILFKTFVQIALTEEAGRLPALLFLLRRRRLSQAAHDYQDPGRPLTEKDLSFAAAIGLISGLAFAVCETASYGAVNLPLALLRAFTAAPIHGACGARVGTAALTWKQEPVRGALRFLSAAALHGAYNFMIVLPGFPSILSILIAFSALASSIMVIRPKPPVEG
jgi:RsiW-degrading membrane proteinase PrsW (M82 family)